VVVSEKDGHLRASAHFYNDESDIDRLLELLPAAAAAA
jgi:selenocysteine lyase/cysteine desulfurase